MTRYDKEWLSLQTQKVEMIQTRLGIFPDGIIPGSMSHETDSRNARIGEIYCSRNPDYDSSQAEF